MKKLLVFALLLSLVASSALAFAQASDFQTGKVVAVDKVESAAPSGGGTDAPVPANKQRYNVRIQLGDMVYVCRVETIQESDLQEWAQGRDVQAKVQGKTMFVKRVTGRIVKFPIVSSKKAS
jgi:hypothetical protein